MPNGAAAYRALVVDDELMVRRVIKQALIDDGFECLVAEHGGQARELLDCAAFDVVITDLRMPVINGHALTCEILAQSPRPLLIVLTGIAEPRLLKDLWRRGVDDVILKPVNPALFAAKIHALLEKRDAAEAPRPTLDSNEPDLAQMILPPDVFYRRVDDLLEIPPLSPAVLDVFAMASCDDGDAEQLAANVARDAALAADVLRLANSAYHNPSGQHIGELREAVARLGRRRIAGLALSRHALLLTSSASELVDLQLAWKQSVGAGVAIELLLDATGQKSAGDRLFLCAVMHSLGRLILISLFPLVYRQFLARCRATGETLGYVESSIFPETHGQVLRQVLERWGVPLAVAMPLGSIADTFRQVRELDDPLREQVELVKLAALISRIAAGTYNAWDEVDFPSHDTLTRLRLHRINLSALIEQTRQDSHLLFIVGNSDHMTASSPANSPAKTPRVGYCCPFVGVDWLLHLLPLLGVAPLHSAADEFAPGCGVILNCLESRPPREIRTGTLVIAATDNEHWVSSQSGELFLPTSFARLQSAVTKLAVDNPLDDCYAQQHSGDRCRPFCPDEFCLS